MAPLQPGDKFPSDVIFGYVKTESDNPKSADMPVDYDASKEWAEKKVVLFSVPGAFHPRLSGRTHLLNS
jgi:alkyl hydroperoxide reductase 1